MRYCCIQWWMQTRTSCTAKYLHMYLCVAQIGPAVLPACCIRPSRSVKALACSKHLDLILPRRGRSKSAIDSQRRIKINRYCTGSFRPQIRRSSLCPVSSFAWPESGTCRPWRASLCYPAGSRAVSKRCCQWANLFIQLMQRQFLLTMSIPLISVMKNTHLYSHFHPRTRQTCLFSLHIDIRAACTIHTAGRATGPI